MKSFLVRASAFSKGGLKGYGMLLFVTHKVLPHGVTDGKFLLDFAGLVLWVILTKFLQTKPLKKETETQTL